MPANSSGGYLSLFSPESANDSSKTNPIVAVEFDSNQNPWDPSSDHVGINVNSTVSVTNVSWNSGIKDGRVAYAWVSYISVSNMLSVYLTYEANPVYSGQSSLIHILTLKDVLPEKVRIGFSAATGASYETHNILSWFFVSSLEVNDTGSETSSHKEGKGNASLGIGLGMAFGVLSCVVRFVWFIFWRRRVARRKELEEEYDGSIGYEFGGTAPKRFTYRELSLATKKFSEEGKLGEGGFGGVYKGWLSETNTDVAVKRVPKGSKQEEKEYVSEVKIISRFKA